MTKFVLAFDGSATAQRAVEKLTKLVKDGDQVHVANVIEHTYDNDMPGAADKNAQLKAKASETLLPALQALRACAGVDVVEVVLTGDTREVLPDYTEKHTIDFLVVGSRGLKGIKKLLFGSTTDYLVRSTALDVIVVKPE